MSKAWIFRLAEAICARLGVAQDAKALPVVNNIAEMIETETAYQIRVLRSTAQKALRFMPDGEERSNLERAIQAFSDITLLEDR